MPQIVVSSPRRMLGVALCWVTAIAGAQLGCEAGSSASSASAQPPPAPPAAAGVGATSGAPTDTAAAAAQPTAPTQPSPKGKGPVASGEAFEVWLQAPSPLTAGTPGKVEWVLKAKPPYHCNEEYPHKLKLDAPPAEMAFPQTLVRGMVVKPERGELSIPVEPKTKGLARVSGTAHFSVCTDARCLIEKHSVSVDVQIH